MESMLTLIGKNNRSEAVVRKGAAAGGDVKRMFHLENEPMIEKINVETDRW